MTSPSDAAARLRVLSAHLLHLDEAVLVPEARLSDDLGVDSLAAIEWGMVIEDELDIELPEDAWPGLATYGDVEALVGRAAAGAAR